MTRSSAPFHDYTLVGYTVSCESAEITFHAKRVEPGEPRRTEIVFTGVVAYDFEYDTFDTILGYVIEAPLAEFLEEHAARFFAGAAQSGWARFWRGSVEDTARELTSASIHAFQISSAIGMRGWVLAQSFTSRAVVT